MYAIAYTHKYLAHTNFQKKSATLWVFGPLSHHLFCFHTVFEKMVGSISD